VIGGVMIFTSNMQRILTLWGESQQMSVYLSDPTTTENISSLEKYFSENTNIDNLKFVKKEDALIQFREQMASYAPDLLQDSDLLKFIPASYQFSINKKVPAQDQLSIMQDIAVALKVQPGVEEVNYGQEWIKSYSTLTTGLQWAGAIFMLIIFVSAGFVMSNSVHSSIQQRRHEIEVYELIGATAKHIRTPFLWEGAFLGGLSCVLALGLSYGIFESLKDFLKNQISFLQITQHLQFINANTIVGLVTFAIFLGGFSAWLCLRRINTGWAASQRISEAQRA
jgi:cell division transport system permease protein